MVVHGGEEDATAFSDVGLIVIYSDNATRRISTHDLEETLFHESVHAAWDRRHGSSTQWLEAQTSDGAFVTHYARKNPDGEDLAESALFAYTLLHHPERIPAADATEILTAIPARIAYVEDLLPPGEPIFHPVGPRYECDGSGTTFTVDEERRSGFVGQSGSGQPNECIAVDRSTARGLSDIVSNALVRGLLRDESEVFSFLADARDRYSTADELLEATVNEFGLDRATLDAQVQKFFHCNCKHGDVIDTPADLMSNPPRSSVAESVGAVARESLDGPESTGIRSTLYLIASLLLLLLVVNASTLVVLIKQSRTAT